MLVIDIPTEYLKLNPLEPRDIGLQLMMPTRAMLQLECSKTAMPQRFRAGDKIRSGPQMGGLAT